MTANLDLVVTSGGKLESKMLALQHLNSFATAKVICKDNPASIFLALLLEVVLFLALVCTHAIVERRIRRSNFHFRSKSPFKVSSFQREV